MMDARTAMRQRSMYGEYIGNVTNEFVAFWATRPPNMELTSANLENAIAQMGGYIPVIRGMVSEFIERERAKHMSVPAVSLKQQCKEAVGQWYLWQKKPLRRNMRQDSPV